MNKKDLTIKQVATMGGHAKFAKYGKQGMSDMAKLAGDKNKQRGSEYFAAIGAKGAKAKWDKVKAERKQIEKQEKVNSILGLLTGHPKKQA